jgi:natural product precursor
MKKLKLNFSSLTGDVLSREELKNVIGGFGSGDDAAGECKDKAQSACTSTTTCSVKLDGTTYNGTCGWNTHDSKCVCNAVG